ncbi:serine/threonine protein kinase [Polynucleobacter paneuropaeus]|uniref:serine/threonine protein kinase n=1 Tax=Polynucleobacter paneuropaeus TaxID=2527775 RepID=UPI001BFE4AA0|nr:serine/threonine-protein kinase [Polynucleobacter paneuropaeus]MBT8622535.1 serine/threonine protein kinase [Polynucleobacter paneuropaeus]
MSDSFEGLPNGYQILEYELKEVLGQGGFGITYLAIDLNLNKKVAIKEYFPREFSARNEGNTIRPIGSQADRDTFAWGLKRFLEEARTLALFENPNIVSVKRFFEANGTAYLVMEYCDGQSLDEIIKNEGPLSEDKILKILKPLLDSLKNIHSANFLHRDVKPANIFIREDGSPVLLDFGSARKHLSSHSKTVTSLATVGYAPVEQYSTSGMQGPPVDIYGLAATLYRAITGERPQDALDRVLDDDLVPLVKREDIKINKKLLAAIDHGMAVRPENRPQTIAEWRSEFNLPLGADLNPQTSNPPKFGNNFFSVATIGHAVSSSRLKYSAFALIFFMAIGLISYIALTGNKAGYTESQAPVKSTPIPQATVSQEPNPFAKYVTKVPEPNKAPEKILVGHIYQVYAWSDEAMGGAALKIEPNVKLRNKDIVFIDNGSRFRIENSDGQYASMLKISGKTALKVGMNVWSYSSSNDIANPANVKKSDVVPDDRVVGTVETYNQGKGGYVRVLIKPGSEFPTFMAYINSVAYRVDRIGEKYAYLTRFDGRAIDGKEIGRPVLRPF